MAVVVGVLGTQPLAEAALQRLNELGFGDGELSLVSRATRPAGATKDEEQRAS